MTVADQRVLKATPAVLSATFVDQDGAPADPAGAVTVGITRAVGSLLVAAGTATVSGPGVGVRTIVLTATQTGDLDRLACTWTAASGEVVVTNVDIVGAFAFTLADLTALDGMSGALPAELRSLRRAVEELLELRTGWAWTPRLVVDTFTRAYGGTYPYPLQLSTLPYRASRAILIGGVAETLTNWSFGSWGDLTRILGWTETVTPVPMQVIYEAGEDHPPASLTRALIDAAKQTSLDRRSGVGARVLGETNQFGNLSYARATAENLFGNPAVDAVFAAWDRRTRMATA